MLQKDNAVLSSKACNMSLVEFDLRKPLCPVNTDLLLLVWCTACSLGQSESCIFVSHHACLDYAVFPSACIVIIW